jgi:hypothetical protein
LPQYDFGTIDPATKSGSGLATDLNNWRDALHSTHKDSAAPSYKVAGTPWIDDSASPWATKIYDGADWITTGYIDPTNNSWTPAKAVTGYRVVGCNCANNSTTPNTQFDLDADLIVLADSNGYTHAIYDPGAAITNNISTAGPAANGRDQAGAFSNSSWVHFYWIWNGTTLASLSSATAPPTGPTLPSGYTHWAYAGAVYLDSGGALKSVFIKGAWVYYNPQVVVLNSGSVNTTESSFTIGAAVPPNTQSYLLNTDMQGIASAGGNVISTFRLRVVSGVNYTPIALLRATANNSYSSLAMHELPFVSATVYYIFDNNTNISSNLVSIGLLGYQIPNGGE